MYGRSLLSMTACIPSPAWRLTLTTPMRSWWAAETGVTSGTSDTTFSTSDNCTRAQIVTFLFRCLGEE